MWQKYYTGSGTDSNNFWHGDLGTFGSDEEERRGHTNWFYEADNGEAVAEEGRKEVGDSQVKRNAGSGGDSVVDELHLETIQDSDTVIGAADDF